MVPIMKPFIISLFLAALIAIPGSPAPQKGASESPRAAQEDNIREAVIRYQIKKLELVVAYHFIAINGKNPPEAFILRFRDLDPPVRPISESLSVKKPMRAIMSRKDQKQGVIFRVGDIKWISDAKVDVESSLECGDSCDETSGLYHVTSQDGKWVVESFDPAPKKSS